MISGAKWKFGVVMVILTSCGSGDDDECTDLDPVPDNIRVVDATTGENLCAASLSLTQDGKETVFPANQSCSFLVGTQSTYTATATAPGYLSESVTVPGAKCREGISRILSLKKAP